MSTRCVIALKQTNGSFSWIYCHHDGYMEGVGATLQTHYASYDGAKTGALLKLGDISTLGETPELPPDGDFDNRDHHYTIAYSLRGEQTPAHTSENLMELALDAVRCGAEYLYIMELHDDGSGADKMMWRMFNIKFPLGEDRLLADYNAILQP